MSKKVNGILKGVAGVGTVLGGASIVTDADVVYAYEESQSEVQEVEEQASGSGAQSEYIDEYAVAEAMEAEESGFVEKALSTVEWEAHLAGKKAAKYDEIKAANYDAWWNEEYNKLEPDENNWDYKVAYNTVGLELVTLPSKSSQWLLKQLHMQK